MKPYKVTYQTSQGLIFNTIIHAENEDAVIGTMYREYAFHLIKVLKIRPSVKQKYSRVCNYRIR